MSDFTRKGLTTEQVEDSWKKHGKNQIAEKEPPSFWQEFIGNFEDDMIKILCGISAIMLILYLLSLVGIIPKGSVDWYEPVGTMMAVVIVNFIVAKTSMSSDAAYRKLRASTKKETTKVIRNGVLEVISVDEVAVGDIVLLQAGDKIPADGALIEGNLRLDNSALNGEAEECKKFACEEGFVIPDEITGDTFVDKHSLFKGAIVFNGEGLMEIQKVGMKTMMGKMAEDMADDEVDSPLKVKLGVLAGQISTFGYIGAVAISLAYLIHFIWNAGGVGAWLSDFRTPTNAEMIIIVACGFMSAVGITFIKCKKILKDGNMQDVSIGKTICVNVLIGIITSLVISTVICDIGIFNDITRAVMVAIVIIVCAVPEGLPLMISLVLMQNTGRLLEHNCLVRKAVGIETAGGVNILFSDKTGTITKGELEVVEVFNGKAEAITKQINMMNIAIARNTSAMFDGSGKVAGGNATDQALVKFLGQSNFDKYNEDSMYKITESQGFNSANKFSQSRIDGAGKTLYKGAPEKLLAKAKKYINEDGKVLDINVDVINKKIDALAVKAMRVLAFGYSEERMVENEINDDLVIIGFVGIRDDIRQEAKEAIKDVHEAGIQVVMITGDRLETAIAIAKDANLISDTYTVMQKYDRGTLIGLGIAANMDEALNKKDEIQIAITSSCLNEMSDKEVKGIMPYIKVIARALPTDKSRMVRLCQEMNLVCAMTGDGVNDCPAIKRADVGFSMGLRGTEAAKEASDIVITDDNFKSIKDAVWYGRTIYHNILKFCKVQLSINVGAVVLSAIGPFIGIEEPLTVTQLLFVNLCMDGLASIMLGNEPALKRYMDEKPRQRDEKIIKKPMFIQFTLMGLYLATMSIVICKVPAITNIIGTPEQVKTVIFPLFIFSAMFNVFNCRAEDLHLLHRIKENNRFFPVWFAILGVTVVITMFGGKLFGCTPIGINAWIIVVIVAAMTIPFDITRKVITKAITGSYS